MQIQLHNVSTDQLEGLQKNFTEKELIVDTGSEGGKYNVSIQMNNELDAWKLFFAGGEYVMAKFNKRVNEIS